MHICFASGPIGDSATENIKIHYSEAGSLSPNGRKSVYGPPKPEYGGSKEWRYKGPDIEGIPEGVQPFQDADKLPVGVRLGRLWLCPLSIA